MNNLKNEYNIKAAAHPMTVLINLILKGVPIAAYYIFWLVISSSSLKLITVYIFSSIDFWFVKNLAGRILVGLRWERYIDENGEEQIVYHKKQVGYEANGVDSKFFWNLQYLQSAIWGLFFAWNVITFDLNDLIVIALPAILSILNTYHYFKCSGDQQAKFSNLAGNLQQKAILEGVKQVNKN